VWRALPSLFGAMLDIVLMIAFCFMLGCKGSSKSMPVTVLERRARPSKDYEVSKKYGIQLWIATEEKRRLFSVAQLTFSLSHFEHSK